MVEVSRLGLRLKLDLRDNLQRILYFCGTYEPELLEFLERVVEVDDTFVDVGAHIGIHSLFVASRLRQLGGGTVIAFEPMTDSAVKITSAAQTNHLDVRVVPSGLSKQAARLPLYGVEGRDVHDASVRSLYGDGPAVGQVDLVSFDEWAAATGLARLDIVKLDTEGAELSVLEGMSRSLAELRPRCIVVELQEEVLGRSPHGARDLALFMTSMGYRESGRNLNGNIVYIHSGAKPS